MNFKITLALALTVLTSTAMASNAVLYNGHLIESEAQLHQTTPLTINIPVDIHDHNAGNPTLGYWMVTSDDEVAHWLGEKKDGKYTLEPINVEFLVKADTASSAFTKLNNALVSGAIDFGHFSPIHSSGYKGFIGGVEYEQQGNKTYSDNSWYKQNDHMRVFGPTKVSYNGYYVFTASCSEETGIFFEGANLLGHHFVSFNHCRDTLLNRFKANGYKEQYFRMNNTYSDANFTTRDHDGNIAQITI